MMRKLLIGTACLACGSIFVVFFVIVFTLDRPPGFALEQVVNHYHHRRDGIPQVVAGWLIRAGISRDWAAQEPATHQKAPFPLLRTAASPTAVYPYQTYAGDGQPQGLSPAPFLPPVGTRIVDVADTADISSAIRNAQAGDIITIAPGTYNLTARSIPVEAAGTKHQPIYLRAESFGTALLNLDTLEGFHVRAPFWVFENLRIQGVCTKHSDCEHGFHVVGKGKSFTLRNSEVLNFNAPIKVNLQSIQGKYYYPDDGLVEFNNFYNETPRDTGSPVALLNINAADRWVVRGNYLADFVKNGGDHTSYGAFMKSNARGGMFERNLVICEHRLPADEGIRVGLSFGGGGSTTPFCRGQDCTVEFSEGVMRNNIIMNCSRDVGIYLKRAAQIGIYHNLLYNNLGIDVRFDASSASITNNIISGRIRNRDRGYSTVMGNLVFRDCLGESRRSCELSRIYRDPERGDFRFQTLENPVWQITVEPAKIERGFCGLPVPDVVNVGPIQYLNGLDCLVTSARPGSG